MRKLFEYWKKNKQEIVSNFLDFVMRHTLVVILICSFLYVITYFEQIQKWLAEFEISSLKMHVFFQAVIFLLVTINVFNFLKRFVAEKLFKKTKLDKSVRYSILVLIGYLGWFIAGWGTLSIFGINMNKIAIVFGALSVGIGFGLQNMVNNFISGIMILFERPIKTGDWIVINGNEGIVKSIKIRATELQTFDQTSILIPNADILSNPLTNLTHTDTLGRMILKVGVSYNSDLLKVRKILLKSATKHSKILKIPAPYVLLTNFAESSVDFELRAVVENVMDRIYVQSDVMFSIFEAFEKEGIEIPFPQRVVHMIKEEEK